MIAPFASRAAEGLERAVMQVLGEEQDKYDLMLGQEKFVLQNLHIASE